MKPIAENRRAGFDYEILEKYEAGIGLSGQEVKSAKSGRFNLAGSYAIPKNGEFWLVNADIPAYQPKNASPDYDPSRSRKLLLCSCFCNSAKAEKAIALRTRASSNVKLQKRTTSPKTASGWHCKSS